MPTRRPVMHLSCPSGLSGNLLVSAYAAVGAATPDIDWLVAQLGFSPWLRWKWGELSGSDARVGDSVYRDVEGLDAPRGTSADMSSRAAKVLGEQCGELVRRFTDAMYGPGNSIVVSGETFCDTTVDLTMAAAGVLALRGPLVVHGPLPSTGRDHHTARDLLSDWMWEPEAVHAELVTPTAAAVLRVAGVQTTEPMPAGAFSLTGRFARRYRLDPTQAMLAY